jgi:hypothetical protein
MQPPSNMKAAPETSFTRCWRRRGTPRRRTRAAEAARGAVERLRGGVL